MTINTRIILALIAGLIIANCAGCGAGDPDEDVTQPTEHITDPQPKQAPTRG